MSNTVPIDRRILVVEDNFLVAIALADMLRTFGCEVVGPVASVEDGLALVERGGFDGAVLDINIAGGTCAPIAEALRRAGRPFLFVTGYGSPSTLPESLASVRRLQKPVDEELLRTVLESVMP